MKRNFLWLLLASTAAGIAYYCARQTKLHREWKQERDRILARAKKSGHGEFVL